MRLDSVLCTGTAPAMFRQGDYDVREALRGALLDRAQEFAAVELLLRAVALRDLDARGFRTLLCREAPAAAVAGTPATDGAALVRLPRIDDARVGPIAGGAAHDHKIWDGRAQA